MPSKSSNNESSGLRIRKETKIKKSCATELMSVSMIDEKRLKGYFRVFVGGPQGESPLEVVLHHPVGITDLDDDDWVASSPYDLAKLLERVKDPNQQAISDARSAHIRNAAILNGCLTVNGDGKMVLGETGVLRSTFLKDFEKFVKEDRNEKNFKFNLAAALVQYPDYVGVAEEAEYARVKVTYTAAAIGAVPQTYAPWAGVSTTSPRSRLPG
jgi:hypothetical protein